MRKGSDAAASSRLIVVISDVCRSAITAYNSAITLHCSGSSFRLLGIPTVCVSLGHAAY
jgi:hypothetical protein